jgi:hypothetical protein
MGVDVGLGCLKYYLEGRDFRPLALTTPKSDSYPAVA